MEEVSFGAGCFWGVEHALKQVNGVINTTCGYQGGTTDAPTYEDICSKATGHAEVVLVKYNPTIISFDRLLDAFFFMHDPTQLNRQGPDTGDQYRSVIFCTTEEQKLLAKEKISNMKKNIVTLVEDFPSFYDAEKHHQEYLNKNPNGYCHIGLETFSKLKNNEY